MNFRIFLLKGQEVKEKNLNFIVQSTFFTKNCKQPNTTPVLDTTMYFPADTIALLTPSADSNPKIMKIN